ncbi:MAG TPA: secretin N-terminal domain-containing protein [Thermoanaerobaculia bacterium]|jgi:general secretion pathway protein D|nr:secretin N-terminal domain-containing protein [Thermoanaerobaculia bacterium]
MNRIKQPVATLLIALLLSSCASYNAYKQAQAAEQSKDWDRAVAQYERAIEIDPDNRDYRLSLDRARREASRSHFEKGKVLRTEASRATGADQFRLAQLAATELQLVVKLDPTNQFAGVELTKAYQMIQDLQRAASESVSIDEIKKRAQANITKAQPPQLNPTSNEPISLTFSRDTPIKDIYKALGNAFGINVLFDQAVKDDRITIELRDVTAQQALERVMQAGNHFYKVLDEKTIIVVPDNPQARRDYEDLVIRTFYLSNGDAEQVTNVVRTMIEARNVFPLKALNAITIRDTADKVRIAEKIIEANDKAKAEVVVQVELVQLDLNRIRDIGMAISGFQDSEGNSSSSAQAAFAGGFNGGTLAKIQEMAGSLSALRNNLNFSIPTATYSLLKTYGNSELLANPELRISEGEKATLHIGQRIPVPVTTISGYNPTTSGNNPNLTVPYTSFQYQDVGIKVGMEPRVHHNHEVTLKLTVEVSNRGADVEFGGQRQPTFATRTIESTIRLKDGETNFLAGLIQTNKVKSATKTPILGDIPLIGRLFTNEHRDETRTDLVLTMTPHIVRMPNITEEDVAPMWVGTGNNLTFRGVSPRIESQSGADPFVANPMAGRQLAEDGEPGNYIVPEATETPVQQQPTPGMPNDPFRRQQEQQPPPNPNNPPEIQNENPPQSSGLTSSFMSKPVSSEAAVEPELETAALRLSPRIAPQPSTISLGPGESRLWSIVGMDLDGLHAPELMLNFNPLAMEVTDVSVGSALRVDPALPPVITVDRTAGTIRVKSSDGKPLQFVSGGDVLLIRVHGGVSGETFLVMKDPEFRTPGGKNVVAAVAGGRAKVQ